MNGSPRRERSRSVSPRAPRGRSYSRSRSHSKSRRTSGGGYRGSRGGGGRSHSRSPMSGRRRHTGHRVSPAPQPGGGSRRPFPRSDSSRNSRVLQENPGPNKCLGVFGLSLRTTERDLREVFTRYGPIDECTVVIDAQTGRSRGFSFIYFENIEDAKAAKESCNGIEIDGRRIRVDFSITQRAHTPTPGIYMGKPMERKGGYRGSGGGGRRDDYRDRDRGYRRSPSPYRSRRRYTRSRSYSPRK